MKGYHDIAGDGGSDVIGQVVAKKSKIAESLADVRHLVAIGSGKGGVGKSTLTMQLAEALRARGGRIAILDFLATTWPMTSEPPSPAMSW